MTILFDINHPAHIHYFRNIIKKLGKEGNEVITVSRNKELEHELLDIYGIEFISRGKGAQSILGRLVYHFYAVLLIVKVIVFYKVDLVISFMHPYAAQAAWLTKKPSIVFTDTENASLHHLFTVPFANQIHSPFTFSKNLGKKHFKFYSFMELSYLNRSTFKFDVKKLEDLNIDKDENFALIRFVSKKSLHDWRQIGISNSDKLALVLRLSEHMRVFISSEVDLPDELEKFKINISPDKIHYVLHEASIYIGESATMAAESIFLGTPVVFISNNYRGYIDHLREETNILFQFKENENGVKEAIKKAIELALNKNLIKDDIRNKLVNKYLSTDRYIYKQIIKVLSTPK